MTSVEQDAGERESASDEIPVSVLLVGMLFLLIHGLVYLVRAPGSDAMGVYSDYAWEYNQAQTGGVSLYEVHEKEMEKLSQEARARGYDHIAQELQANRKVEYPPLVLAAIFLPEIVAGPLGKHASLTTEAKRAYTKVFRLFLMLIDLVLFLLLASLLLREEKLQGKIGVAERLAVYTMSGLVLWPLLYDRLDPIQSGLTLLALVLLISRWHYAWSFFVLALAVNFKVVPIVFAPIWVVGSLPVSWKNSGSESGLWKRLLLAGFGRSLLFLSFVLGIFSVCYGVAGPHSIDFLSYHRERGLELESTYSSVLQLMYQLGEHPIEVQGGFGGVNLVSPASSMLAKLSPGVILLLLLVGIALMIRVYVRCGTAEATPIEKDTMRFARAFPQEWTGLVALFLLLAIAGSKVFSAQYMLWLIPLVPLVSLNGPTSTRIFLWTFVIVCLLTTVIFPFLFWKHLAVTTTPALRIFGNPTVQGSTVLTIRNGLLLILTVSIAVSLFRRTPAFPEGPPDSR